MQIKSVDTLLNNILTLHCPTVARLYTNKNPQRTSFIISMMFQKRTMLMMMHREQAFIII